VSGFLVAHDFPFLVLAVIMSMENAAQGHTMVEEEEEAVMKNLQSGGSGSSSGTYHSPEDEFAHLFLKRGAIKVQLTVTLTISLSSKRYGNP
jgi:hypothetical protein